MTNNYLYNPLFKWNTYFYIYPILILVLYEIHSGTFLRTIKESQRFQIFWAQQLISTHHTRLHVVFTGSSEFMNYMYTQWLGSTDFPKTLKPFQKPRCQRSGIKEVHNLNFRHCLGVLPYRTWKCLEYGCNLTHSCIWLASMWTLERHSLYVSWRLYILKSRILLWKQLNMKF
jgi:hypothetical protein